MTGEPAAPEDAVEPGEPEPLPTADLPPATADVPSSQPSFRKQPIWTYFLTPVAIVMGSMIISGMIWYTRDDASSAATGAVAVTGGESVATVPGIASTPAAAQDLLATFNGYAKQVGLDQAKFQQCLGKQDNVQLINTQLQRGAQLGVDGTPTFFINNKKIVGAQPQAIFDEVIAAELNGSPTSLDGYSASIKQLAAVNPPRFEIMPAKVDVSDAQFEGNPKAKVIIAEFSDFQCPFCKQWTDQNLKRIRALEGNDVALAFLHFPLTQIHPNAGNASLVAICAGEQGKFWQMHDLLFARQSEWQNLRAN
jgi:protein-disulfide isomerase